MTLTLTQADVVVVEYASPENVPALASELLVRDCASATTGTVCRSASSSCVKTRHNDTVDFTYTLPGN